MTWQTPGRNHRYGLPYMKRVYTGPSFGRVLFYPNFAASSRSLHALLIPLLLLIALPAAAQSDLGLEYGGRFSIVEREDLRVYEDGSYRGFRYREKRGYFRAAGSARGRRYEGEIYLVGAMKRQAKLQEKPVDDVHEVAFILQDNGYMRTKEGVYPLRKGFPRFPAEEVQPGDSWTAEGEERYRTESGELISVGFDCRYTYRGRDIYMQRPVRVVDIEYVFGGRSDSGSRREVRGKVDGSLILFTDAKAGYFVRERIERRITGGGSEIRETGFRLTWSTGISPASIDSLEQKIVGALGGDGDNGGASSGDGSGGRSPGTESSDTGGASGTGAGVSGSEGSGKSEGGQDGGGRTDSAESGGIAVERRDEGLVLNLPNIHFVPDQARVLPEERDRLDRLAELLKLAPDSTFLVKGHTADVGTKKSQYELSVERARTIIAEMGRRGIPEKNFLYRGLGGDEPVASNETEAGRARNRRVEIIILDG